MPRGRAKEPGVRALPNVPYRSDEGGPNTYDVDTRRGPLSSVPRDPIYRCMDFGGSPNLDTGGIGSPARADFTRGRPDFTREMRDRRTLPENQLIGSLNTMAGLGVPIKSRQLKGEGGPVLQEGD